MLIGIYCTQGQIHWFAEESLLEDGWSASAAGSGTGRTKRCRPCSRMKVVVACVVGRALVVEGVFIAHGVVGVGRALDGAREGDVEEVAGMGRW